MQRAAGLRRGAEAGNEESSQQDDQIPHLGRAGGIPAEIEEATYVNGGTR